MKIIVSTIAEKRLIKGISLLDSSDFIENQKYLMVKCHCFLRVEDEGGLLAPQNKGIIGF